MAVTRVLDRVGQVLGGRFRLLAPIGTGASASVYVAEDVVLRRRVAVKVLHAALADDEAFLRRFRAEAHAAAALNHPHIVAIYDWGQDADADPDVSSARASGVKGHGVPYLVTEYLGGGSLRAMLDATGPLTPAQALLVGLEAARGLEYAHRRGFVHRDIKPANLLFDDEARLRIADFGLARALAEAAWTEPMGAVLGTARYASPEQARGESLDGKSDVYSLALVIIEAATGHVPFAADTTIGTLMARVNQPLRVPDELVALRQPLEWAGVPDPSMRPDAAEFGAALMAAAVDFDRPPALTLAGAHVDGETLAQLFDATEQGGAPAPEHGLEAAIPAALGLATTMSTAVEPPAVGATDLADDPRVDHADDPDMGSGTGAHIGTDTDTEGEAGPGGGSDGAGTAMRTAGSAATGAALAGSALEAAVAAGGAVPLAPIEPIAPTAATTMTTASAFAPGGPEHDADDPYQPHQPHVLDASGRPFDRSIADGADAGSFLIAGPGWDPANDRAAFVPGHEVIDPAPDLPGHGPTDELPQPGPRRKRRGLGRVLPLTAGPDAALPGTVPAAGEPSIGTAALDPGVTTAVARTIAPATDPARGANGRWNGSTAAPAPVPPVGVEPTMRREDASAAWGLGYAPSPYDSVTTELVPPYDPAAPDHDGYDRYDEGDGYGYGDDDGGYGPLSRRDRRAAQRIAEAEAKADRLVAKAEQRIHRRRRWPAVLIVMLLLAGAAGGSAYWWFLVRVPSHPVPALVGKNDAEVEGIIGGFEWVVAKEYQFDDAAPAGQVLSQRPGPNVEVLRGGSLSLVISKGRPPVDVPTNVVGQKRDEAATTLTKAGLGVGSIETRFDEQVPADVVIAIAPGTPAQVLKGTDIGLVVSSGPEPRTIPDGLVGKPGDKAVEALQALGLKASTTEEFSDAISKGNVISVDPGVGKQAPKGATVAVVVSKGPPTVAIPKVEGQSVADATTTLEDAGLKVSGLEGSPRKKVVGTDPASGTTVRLGSSVKIVTDPDAEPEAPKPTTTTTKPR